MRLRAIIEYKCIDSSTAERNKKKSGQPPLDFRSNFSSELPSLISISRDWHLESIWIPFPLDN
jgi:hypothetical protein